MTRRDRRRDRPLLGAAIHVLLACACASGAAGAQVTATPVVRDGDDLRNAIAGPLVAVLSEQFGGRAVDINFESLYTQPLHDGAAMVGGTGAVRVHGRPDGSVGFSFLLPWNPHLKQAGYPEVSVGGAIAGERAIPNDIALVRRLEADVTAAITRRARQSGVSVRLDRIATVEGGDQLLRIDAQGVAYFSRSEAGTPLRILALYDRTRRSWLRLEYGLGQQALRFVSR
jgi:hypothetical protein